MLDKNLVKEIIEGAYKDALKACVTNFINYHQSDKKAEENFLNGLRHIPESRDRALKLLESLGVQNDGQS